MAALYTSKRMKNGPYLHIRKFQEPHGPVLQSLVRRFDSGPGLHLPNCALIYHAFSPVVVPPDATARSGGTLSFALWPGSTKGVASTARACRAATFGRRAIWTNRAKRSALGWIVRKGRYFSGLKSFSFGPTRPEPSANICARFHRNYTRPRALTPHGQVSTIATHARRRSPFPRTAPRSLPDRA